MDRTIGINIDANMDKLGLDLIEHGEYAINLHDFNRDEFDGVNEAV